jgi:death-on-curing protein
VAIEFLTVREVEALHDEQLTLHGGLGGVRDRGSLESAVATPQATFGSEFLHSDVFEMAAAYAYHIAENQPFIDGNKRTGLNVALVFLGLNGWDIDDPDERLYDAMVGISSGTVNKKALARTFESLASPYVDDDQ